MEISDIFRIDGQTLKVFISLCETSSLTRTADAFGMNQSSISYTLDKLRRAVGDPLFVRSGRGITPTEKALALQPRVQELLAGLEGLVASETYSPEVDTRPVAIAISSPALLPEMREVQRQVERLAPKSTLEIRRLAPRERLFGMLDSGDADLAIAVSGETYRMELNHCEFGEDALAIFYDAKVRGPVTSRTEYEAARHAVAGFGGRTPSVVERALASLSINRSIRLAAPTASSLRELIPGTDLIATMPSALRRGSFSNLAHCPVPFDLPPLVYDLVWHRRFDHSGRNQWLRQIVLDAKRTVAATREGREITPRPSLVGA